MDEFLAFANKLGGVSFATLLLVILWGSWKRIWVWGRELPELEARLRGDLLKAEDREQWWRNVAVTAIGIGETQSQVLRVKENREKTLVEDMNKRLE